MSDGRKRNHRFKGLAEGKKQQHTSEIRVKSHDRKSELYFKKNKNTIATVCGLVSHHKYLIYNTGRMGMANAT